MVKNEACDRQRRFDFWVNKEQIRHWGVLCTFATAATCATVTIIERQLRPEREATVRASEIFKSPNNICLSSKHAAQRGGAHQLDSQPRSISSTKQPSSLPPFRNTATYVGLKPSAQQGPPKPSAGAPATTRSEPVRNSLAPAKWPGLYPFQRATLSSNRMETL